MSHSGLLQGNSFGKRKNLQNRETKTAKTSVTAVVCHYTQVRKSEPMLRNGTFFKLVGKGGGKKQKKVP